jgi:MFS family permease
VQTPAPLSYVDRWRALNRSARLYLLHAALLTASLAIYGLFFNLLILALGYPREFLGTLNTVSLRVAAVTSLPLWWLVTRIGLRPALVASAALYVVSALMLALRPDQTVALIAVALGGMAAVLFQVSAPPFMMFHSDERGRDHLFSANAAINIGVAGVGSYIGGFLPSFFGRALDVAVESPLAYRATYGVVGMLLVASLVPLLFIPRRPTTDAHRTQGVPVTTGDTEQAAEGRRQKAERFLGGRWSRFITSVKTRWFATGPGGLSSVVGSQWSVVRRWSFVVPLLIPPFLISWGAALLIPYLNLFFKERFAVPDTTLGAIFAVMGIATGVASLAGPLLSARIGKVGTIIVSQACSIPFLLLLGWSPLLTVAVGAALMRGALFNLGSPLYDAFAMERTDEPSRPVVIGLINGAYTAGYLVAPEISTWIQVAYGFEPLFVLTAVFYLAAVLAMFVLFGRTTKHMSAA